MLLCNFKLFYQNYDTSKYKNYEENIISINKDVLFSIFNKEVFTKASLLKMNKLKGNGEAWGLTITWNHSHSQSRTFDFYLL